MEFHIYFTFVFATTLMILSPGPSIFLTVAHSISYGWQRSLLTVAGATIGIAFQLIIVSIGLASLIVDSSIVFEVLRWVGAVYLIYLGVKQWQSSGNLLVFDTSSVSKTSLIIQGIVVTIPNPKSLIFIASFLPQFIDVTRSLRHQFILIIPTFLIITFLATSFWAFVAGNVRGFLKSHPRVFQSIFRFAGAMMIASGIGLGMAHYI